MSNPRTADLQNILCDNKIYSLAIIHLKTPHMDTQSAEKKPILYA